MANPSGASASAAAQGQIGVLRAQLLEVRRRRGSITRRNVVDEAANPSSPLHGRFEWDDSVAGDKYRLQQAGDLIRSVRVSYREPSGKLQSVRGFVSTAPIAPSNVQAYVPTEEALTDPVVTQILLGELQREIDRLTVKYGHLADYANVLQRAASAAKAS